VHHRRHSFATRDLAKRFAFAGSKATGSGPDAATSKRHHPRLPRPPLPHRLRACHRPRLCLSSWSLTFDSVQGLILDITYSWSTYSSLADLDGGVAFLGFAEGLNCYPKDESTYTTYSGDAKGIKTLVCISAKLSQIFAWSGSTSVRKK
jgi:hypothetical protein